MDTQNRSVGENSNEADVNGRRPKGTQHISVEMATFAISALLFYQQHPDMLVSFVRLFFEDSSALPDREEAMKKLDPSLKQAAEVVSALQIFEGYLRNRTAQGAVTFFYIIHRFMLYQGRTPSREESIDLWQQVWEKVRHIPIVAHEWEEMEKRGDLKGWMAETQDAARRQLRTFKDQLPRVQKNGAEIYRTLLAFLFGEKSEGEETLSALEATSGQN